MSFGKGIEKNITRDEDCVFEGVHLVQIPPYLAI